MNRKRETDSAGDRIGDKAWQTGDGSKVMNPIIEEIPEREAMFLAGFLEAEKSIPTLAPQIAPGRAADFSSFDILPDIPLAEIVVKGEEWKLQYQKQFGLIGRDPLEGLVQTDEGGRLVEDQIKPF